MKYKTIVAIDPGASGGIAVYSRKRAVAVGMPKGVAEVNKLIQKIQQEYEGIIVFIEKVQAYASGKGDDDPGKKFGINKMLKNYSELITVITLNGLPYIEAYPVSWQSTLGLSQRRPKEIEFSKWKTMRKNKYKEFAQASYPEIKVTLKLADALCILDFAKDKLTKDPNWIIDKLVTPD